MAKFVLQPCKLRGTKFVPLKEAQPVVFNWGQLVEKLAPSHSYQARINLRSLRIGSFIGLLKGESSEAAPKNFLLHNINRSARLDWLVKKQPDFEDRLVEVYRVDEVCWDSNFTEFESSPDFPVRESSGAR